MSQAFLGVLPFKLTGAQARVPEEIRIDLRHAYPMQRLPQADVGTGKPGVAAPAAAQAPPTRRPARLVAPPDTPAEPDRRRSTVIPSHWPVDKWHEVIGDPTYADAILDRLVHNAHRIDLAGDSLRRTRPKSLPKD